MKLDRLLKFEVQYDTKKNIVYYLIEFMWDLGARKK